MSEVPSPPSDLVARGRGRRFWRHVMGTYDLRLDERELLAEVCRQLDLVEELRGQVGRDGATVAGSRGQRAVHPALVELRQVRQELRRTFAQFDWPDDEAVSSQRARRAAQQRWNAAKEARGA